MSQGNRNTQQLSSFTNKNPRSERDEFVQQTEVEFIDKTQERKNEDTKGFRLDHYTFWMGFSWIARQFYLNYTKILILIRSNIISKKKTIQLEHIPKLEQNLKVQSTLELYEAFLNGLGKEEGLTASDITNMIKKTFKWDFLAVHTFVILEIFCKIFNSVLIQQIITTFQEEYSEGSSNYKMSVIYTFILFVLIFLALNFRNKFSFIIEQESTQARQGLIALLYKKVGSMTQYQISKASIGKLFNLMSSDLGSIEVLMPYTFQALWTPLLIIATAVIIYIRLGPYGLLAIAFVLIIYPSQQILGKLQYKYFAMKNVRSDERIKLINESIEGIRLIKMYGWENAIGEQIDSIRKKEQHSIFNIVLNRAADRAFSNALILIAAFLPIIAIHYAGDDSVDLDSAKIFATLEQINGLKFMLILSGVGVGFIYQWKEISKRFASFVGLKNQYTKKVVKNPKYNEEVAQLQSSVTTKQTKKEKVTQEELEILKINPFIEVENQKNSKTNQFAQTDNSRNSIEFSDDFECFWERNERKHEPCVKFGKTMNFEKGKFYGIVGKIGSGKSSLFQILIQEMPFYQGEIRVSGRMAYVEQEPYIFSGKVIDNILFGREMNKQFYKQVVEACCLQEDLDSFPNGDQTEIGERGITLSGGQKARLSLARAVYSESDIYLLDDPLSAVDAKVAKSLHQLCLMGLLKGKTILLVTHQIHFTRQCDEILIFEEGKLTGQGQFEELKERIFQIEKKPDSDKKGENEDQNNNLDHVDCIQINPENKENDDAKKVSNKQEEKGKGLFTKEEDEQVKVTFSTLKKYLSQSNGCILVVFAILMFAASEVLFTFFYRIIGEYDSEEDKDKLFKNSGIILAFYTLSTYLKYFSIAAVTYNSNKEIHRKMFDRLSRAPVTYFESNPSGRIVTKFSNDVGTMDFVLYFHLVDCTENPMTFANLILTVSLYNYYFFILAAFYAFALFWWLSYSSELIVQSKSLDNIYKAPMLSFFSKTIQGVVNLKVYGQVTSFFKRFCDLSNDSIRTNHWYYQAGRAFSYNGQVFSSLITFSGILIAIYTSSSSEELGQSIVYLSIIIELNNYLIRQLIQLDSSLTSVERVWRIVTIEPEGPLKLKTDDQIIKQQLQLKDSQKTPSNKSLNHVKWVQNGSLEFKNVFMKYRETLDYTLKGVNFKIESGEHVGCIGRTGAGKSSLLQALFRMVEIEQSALQSSKNGKILVDGVDISGMGLNTLRSNISIIPQSSFVFSGTIRKNIDPLGLYEESEIIEALKLTGLLDLVNGLDKKLDTDMTNAQSVFSVGQKQLICLARAILSKSKLVVLDEATANLDIGTDRLIQHTIKNSFKNSTIFTIAHRLNTIADYDKILVMSDGVVAEFESPFKLLVNDIHDTQITSNSIFAQMVKHTGKSNSQSIFEVAKQKYFSSRDAK